MRILHVIGNLDPVYGGPPKIAACLASAQAGLGHDVRILSHSSPGRDEHVQSLLDAVPGIGKVGIDQVACRSGWRWLFQARLKQVMRDAVHQADVVHIHNVWEFMLVAAANECRRTGKPYIILLNGMLDPWSLSQKKLKKKLAIALLYRRMYSGAAALHLGNKDEQELIRPLGLTTPGRIIPNGVFEDELKSLPPAGTFYQMHPELQGKPFILFMSRLHYKKGLDYLADAFGHFARLDLNAHLVVAGPEEGAGPAFREQIKSLGLSDRVHLIGSVSGQEKRGALVDASCFCLPSHQEGFSVAITEAIGHGLPAVITEGCHFPEVAEAGAGYVLPMDAEKIGHALHKVMSDPQLRDSMGLKGRDLALSRYTWPKIAEQTLDAYRTALEKDSARTPG